MTANADVYAVQGGGIIGRRQACMDAITVSVAGLPRVLADQDVRVAFLQEQDKNKIGANQTAN